MFEINLIIPVLVSFIVVLFLTPLWIKRAKKAGISGKDMHKISKKPVAESGGVIVLLGFILGVLIYIYLKTFQFQSAGNLIEIFAILASLLIVGFLGFIDDLLGWKIGLNKKTRLLLVFFAAIPLIVVNAGDSEMMGIEFGLLFPLFLIPLGVIATTTTFNFLAGYNGLETSQGIILLSGLAFVIYKTGNPWLSIVILCMITSLIAFYFYNKFPAKVFPGDCLTYPLGAMIAVIAIMGNIEKIAIFFFIPYILETALKSRGRLKKESFAKLKKDGSLDEPYDKIYGLEHLAIRILKKIKSDKKAREKEVVYLINIFQMVIILLGIVLFL